MRFFGGRGFVSLFWLVFCSRRLDISTGELLEVIAACATPQLAAMPLRDLANLSWAFAVQRRLHPEMMAGVGREVSLQWWLAFFSREGVVVIAAASSDVGVKLTSGRNYLPSMRAAAVAMPACFFSLAE